MDAATVRKRLLKAPILAMGGGGRPLYDFKTACEYVVKPKMDIDTYLKTLNPADMPNAINKVYWEAKNIRLKYELAAGQAWATEDVLEVFGTVFMTIKERTKLWVEDLRESAKLSDETLAQLTEKVDAYQTALHADLIAIPLKRQTYSKAVEAVDSNAVPNYEDALG
jgi:hypothetical protein